MGKVVKIHLEEHVWCTSRGKASSWVHRRVCEERCVKGMSCADYLTFVEKKSEENTK